MILAGPDKERKVCVFAGFDGREEIVRSGLSRYLVLCFFWFITNTRDTSLRS
jgi:hypothetical protein